MTNRVLALEMRHQCSIHRSLDVAVTACMIGKRDVVRAMADAIMNVLTQSSIVIN